MTLLEISQIAGALSLFVAAATFMAAQFDRVKKARQERILSWQKVVIFRLIADGVSDFDAIRLSYLAAAQQFAEVQLPKSELQDSTLQLILIQLLADELIMLTEANEYVARRARVTVDEDLMKQMALLQVQKQVNEPKLTSALYEMLERESGAYNLEQLYRKLEAEKLGFSFEDFHVRLREMIARGIVAPGQNEKMWLRSKVPSGKSS
jgi:hypothetical protein